MSLRLNVEALDRWEPQDSQRGRRPSPINDAAPLSSFHTKTDGLREREREREEQVKYRAILGCLQKHKCGKIHLQQSSILKGSIHYRKQTCCVRTGRGVNITIIHVSHSIQQLHMERVSWDNIYKTSVNSLWQFVDVWSSVGSWEPSSLFLVLCGKTASEYKLCAFMDGLSVVTWTYFIMKTWKSDLSQYGTITTTCTCRLKGF